MNNNVIGTNIVKRRHALNISQETLAEASDLSINYISRIERGASKQVSANTLYKISKSLNVSMEELMEKDSKLYVIPGPNQAKLSKYLSKLGLLQSEKLCKQILDLITNYSTK